MTISACLAFCGARNLPLAGLEYSQECYCGTSLAATTLFNATGCSMPCAGDAQSTCGGRSRLSVYNNTSLSPPAAKPVLPGGYAYQGCFTDPSASQRTLPGYAVSNATGMTQELCASTCQGRGYKFAGVEFGKECYCANALSTAANGGKGTQAPEPECSMLCVGDVGELCGGSARIGVWMSGA
jgi:hypothetical protein